MLKFKNFSYRSHLCTRYFSYIKRSPNASEYMFLRNKYRLCDIRKLKSNHFAIASIWSSHSNINKNQRFLENEVLIFDNDKILQRRFLSDYLLQKHFIFKRSFHKTKIVKNDEKPSSEIEATVKELKKESNTKDKQVQALSKQNEKKSLKIRIKEEILHYYHGFKLLVFDTSLAAKYVWRLLNGESLSRREHRQLIRTTSDLFRLVPFSVFVIIPFMELLLPVAIKLFPGMLPSTFETANEKEAKMKKTLKGKLEMAKFLQKTLDNMAVQGSGHRSEKAKEFVQLFSEIQQTGENVSNVDILKFSKVFEDEITLDSLTRPQLAALCRLLEMQPIGTNNFLRFQLRMKLRSLTADDKIIMQEGVDSLAVWELQHACRARGMRAYGLPKETLKLQLQQWLDLSLNEKVPPSLLLLSRTLFLPEKLPTEDTLIATISTLPEEVATRTKAKIGQREGKIDNLTRLEVVKSEERKIKEDKEEILKEIEAKKQKEAQKKNAEQEAKKSIEKESLDLETQVPFHLNNLDATVDKVLVDTAPILTDAAAPIEATDQKEDKLTTEDWDHVEEALEMMEANKKKAFIEEEELMELKMEMKDYEEDIDLFKAALLETDQATKLKESKAAQRLFSSVNRMIKKMDPMLDALNVQKKNLQKIDQHSEDPNQQRKAELINLEELASNMKNLTNASDSHKVEKILSVLSKMDDDLDGSLKAENMMRVLKLLTEDSMGEISTKVFEDVVQIMVKEDQLSAQSLAEKALKLNAITLAAKKDRENEPHVQNETESENKQSKNRNSVSDKENIISCEDVRTKTDENNIARTPKLQENKSKIESRNMKEVERIVSLKETAVKTPKIEIHKDR